MDKLATTKDEAIKVMFEYVEKELLKSGTDGSQTVRGLRRHYEVLLYQACSFNMTDVLKSLLPHLDKISNSRGYFMPSEEYSSHLLYDCLTVAVEKKNHDVIRILLRSANRKLTIAASTDSQSSNDSYCLLHCAAANGDVEVAQLLINSGVDVNHTNGKKETALNFASDAAMAELLLANGADVNGAKSRRTTRKDTPLYYACLTQRMGVVRKLLEHHATTNLGLAELNEACRSESDSKIACALPGLNANSNANNGHHFSASCAYAVLKKNKTELCSTCRRENQCLTARNAFDSEHQKSPPLHQAIYDFHRKKVANGEADLSKINMILSECNETIVNATDKYGTTALYIAIERNLLEVATLLLDSGAKPNHATSGKFPLVVACRYLSSYDFLANMLASGADPNVTDSEGRTSLFFAALSFDLRLVKMLVEHGADVNHLDQKGRTALISLLQQGCSSVLDNKGCVSATSGCVEIVRYLLDNGCNVNLANAKGETALCWTIQLTVDPYVRERYLRGSVCIQLLDLLLERGADSMIGQRYGRNALITAITQDSFYAVQELLIHGADPNQFYCGESLLNVAFRFSKQPTHHVRNLLAAGANLNSITWNSSLTANIDYVEMLLNVGLEINIADTDLLQGSHPNNTAAITVKQMAVLRDFFVTRCSAIRGILRVFAACCSMNILTKFCERQIKHLYNTCCGHWGGRLCQAIVLAGHNVQQQQLIDYLVRSGRPQDHDLVSWLEEHAMTPPTLSCLSRTVVRRQLSVTSRCQTILPLIDILPIPNQMRMYLRFEGPCSEVDFSNSDDADSQSACSCSA